MFMQMKQKHFCELETARELALQLMYRIQELEENWRAFFVVCDVGAGSGVAGGGWQLAVPEPIGELVPG